MTGLSFGTKAAEYAAHRPSYPPEAVRWALGSEASGMRVLDLAAGTGKLTEVLLRLGADVTAVEPDPAMLVELTARLPHVAATEGTAEAIPAPDESFDAVVVGTAYHWFDHDRALPEIARVLRPGGVLAALWNLFDTRVPWVGDLAEASEEPRNLNLWLATVFAEHPAYESAERAEFAWAREQTSEAFVSWTSTRSSVLAKSEHERSELFDRLRAFLGTCAETASGAFELPVVTAVDRAIRS